MGWSGGNEIATSMIPVIKRIVPKAEDRVAIYRALIEILRAQDWDTEDELQGEDADFDRALETEAEDL